MICFIYNLQLGQYNSCSTLTDVQGLKAHTSNALATKTQAAVDYSKKVWARLTTSRIITRNSFNKNKTNLSLLRKRSKDICHKKCAHGRIWYLGFPKEFAHSRFDQIPAALTRSDM